MGMNFKINIMTEIKINTVKELHKLKVLMELTIWNRQKNSKKNTMKVI